MYSLSSSDIIENYYYLIEIIQNDIEKDIQSLKNILQFYKDSYEEDGAEVFEDFQEFFKDRYKDCNYNADVSAFKQILESLNKKLYYLHVNQDIKEYQEQIKNIYQGFMSQEDYNCFLNYEPFE